MVEVFRKGYSYKDRLLRPALVKVAKGDGRRRPATAGMRYTDARTGPPPQGCRT